MSAAGDSGLRRPFHVMAKPMGARCNLGCRYCYYLEKERAFYPAARVPRMDDRTLEGFIRAYIDAQPAEGDITFAWQGGEPTLLGLETFRRIVAWQRGHAPGRRIHNSLQTNGTLLDDAWGAFLREENFLVGISIDGPRLLHDPYRVDAAGHATWEKVRRGLRILRRHQVEFNTLTVVHRRNCRQPEEIYGFLLSEGARHLQFIPLVERKATPAELAAGLHHGAPDSTRLTPAADAAGAVSNESVPAGRFGAFLNAVFDRWVRHDVGRVFVQQFDSALSAWVGAGPTMCVFSERCGRALALEHDGGVYSCDHYVYPEHRFGVIPADSLAALANSPAAARLGEEKARLSSACLGCRHRFACHGDCPKHRFIAAPADGAPLSYLCGDYHAFFSHVAPTMERMAALLRAGRAPAEIMAGAR
ncbi:MAG: anaerobic sulfatase maturase [Opitutaceae bacterium]|jgi:uncharacterized protein|nr:anaerobic sulfatase maturase [Opitutaceae bacterium]